jgi:N-formylglutamate deformylase
MVSNPHSGAFIPPEIAQRMTPAGLEKRDTDWHLSRLYDLPAIESAAMISANLSRYVVDLNRPLDGRALYPGQVSTDVCPRITFSDQPIYLPGQEPGDREIANRIEHYWQPYHDQLREELERLIHQFGFVVLLDVHSIAQRVPMLFEGNLPDFNFGTNHGRSCGAAFRSLIEEFAAGIDGYSHVINGRFVGGYITRHYGDLESVQAVQLELNRSTYMEEDSLEWDFELASEVNPLIESFVVTLMKWAEQQAGSSG